MTKFLALTIGGDTGFTVTGLPSQIQAINSLSLQAIISWAITLTLSVAVILTLVFLIVGGLKWIISGGDKKQLEGAQKTIQYAIIGLVVILLSFFIINFIGLLFGVNLLNVILK